MKLRYWVNAEVGSLRRIIRGETSLVGLTFVATNLIRLLSTIILTRLLAPDSFGAIAMVTSITYIASMLSDVGFTPFMVRHKQGEDPRFRSVVWTARLVRSVFLAAAVYALAEPISAAFQKPELSSLIKVSALYFLIDGMTSLSIVVAIRRRQLLHIGALDVAAAVVQLVTACVLALLLGSAWALMIGILSGSLTRAVLSYVILPDSEVKPAFDKNYVGELVRFGKYVSGSSVITLMVTQTDKLVLTRVFSLDMLGIYMIAASLAAFPTAFVFSYGSRILYPRYAAAWRGAGHIDRHFYYSTRRRVSLLYNTGVGALIGGAPIIVQLLYDPRYTYASVYLRILAIGAFFALTNEAAVQALTAVGNVRANLRANIARLCWLISMAPLGWIIAGVFGFITACALIEVPALIYNYRTLNRNGLFSLREEIVPFGAGGVVMIIVAFCSWLLTNIY